MRIGCLQFAPQVGDVHNNLNRADAVLSRANPEDLDLLVLPELAFTGYNFKSLQEISPHLEPSGSGISSLWARTNALRYNCVVAVGYPEKVDVAQKWPTSPEYYNSLILVNGEGETIANYRKSFLYYTDETWALEGQDGFFEAYIPGLGDCAMGICMDLNPYKFEAPWHAFEFAFHVLEVEADLVVLSMAWLTREDSRMFTRTPKEPDMETLTYWVTRLEPLIRANSENEIIVVFCNRTGVEDDALYTGTSAVIGIKDGEVNVYGMLGRGEKDLLIVDTDSTPYAKLIYRPGGESADSSHIGPQGAAAQPSSSSEHSNKSSASPKSPPPTEKLGSTSPQTRQSMAEDTQRSRPILNTSADATKSSATRKSRPQSPKLEIPYSPSLAEVAAKLREDAAMQPKPKNTEIPTPTGPSPVPESHRPRLTQDRGPSRSQQKRSSSYTHVATPHPNTSRTNDLFSGHVLVSHDRLAPITPFEEAVPASPRYFWVPSDSLLKSPTGVREHTPPVSRSPATGSKISGMTQRNQSPLDVASHGKSTRTTPHRGVADADTHAATERPASVTAELRPVCPDSPKSRNAIRTGRLERSDSYIDQRPDMAFVTQKLDSIRNGLSDGKIESKEGEPTGQRPELPSSPKSRNASRSRPWLPADELIAEQRQGNLSRGSILNSESPAPLGYSNPLGRVAAEKAASGPGQHARSSSATSLSDHPNSRIGNLRHIGPLGSRYENRPQSRNTSRLEETKNSGSIDDQFHPRNVSRGRQPGLDDVAVEPKSIEPPERSQSRRGWHDGHPATRGRSREQFSAAKDHSDIFATEVIRVSPSCPVHGAHSDNSQHSHARHDDIVETQVVRTSPNCPVHGQHHAKSAGEGERRRHSADTQPPPSPQGDSVKQRCGDGDGEQVSIASGSYFEGIPGTKYSSDIVAAEPKTPKAMVLAFEDGEAEVKPGTAPSFQPSDPSRRSETDMIKDIPDRPRSAVW